MLYNIRKSLQWRLFLNVLLLTLFPLPSRLSPQYPSCRRSYSNWLCDSSLSTVISCSIRLVVRTRMEIHPFPIAFIIWREPRASLEADGRLVGENYLKWKRLAPHHHWMLRVGWFAPMAFLASRSPLGVQDHPLALLPGLSASHRCWQAAQAPAVETCHLGCAASILLSLRDMSSFAPDSHAAVDGGNKQAFSLFLWMVPSCKC